MVRLLSKIFFIFCIVWVGSIKGQTERSSDKDYHNKEEFKKFNRRAQLVSSWQIQNLKFGAIVVRLQNNKRKIDAYKKVGDLAGAATVQAETQNHNKVIVRAVTKELTFCKVYFMYSQNSDSLLNGARNGIFLDTNLNVSPNITLNEGFYLIAEELYVKNSSIGFVKEDTAKYQIEKGTIYPYETLVMYNKYGHQLKDPFPLCGRGFISFFNPKIWVKEKVILENGTEKQVSIKTYKNHYKNYARSIQDLNTKLYNFYDRCQGDQINDPSVKPFLY